MAAHRLVSALWEVKGKSFCDSLRLYVRLVFLIIEKIWIRLLPKNRRQTALNNRWKRISWWSQKEKVYIKKLHGYYDMLFYLSNNGKGDFDTEWFQWQRDEVGIQIGANRGEYSLMASRKVGSQGLCIAIEPNPPAYLDLLELIALNKASNVIALPVACGKEEGWVGLELPMDLWGDGVVRVKTQEGQGTPVVANVRMCRLDNLVQGLGLGRCDFLIIDVEGHEGEVLRGAVKVLQRFRPRLYIEIHDSWDEIEKILHEYGYTLRAWTGGRPGRGHLWAMPKPLD